ncbi:MAG: 4-hydroxythreonine-4-phosphate dehydrogenase PdxA [Hyphomicrobiales bacterium]|nr:MAG: 4-hydroxythreonine-4-phosphate dehydrogenase PdxA [Hyphomicrobiales bacterium]
MAALAPIAVSMGEPAGIGPDLILRLYEQRAELQLPPFIVFGSVAFLAARARRLGLNINFAQTTVGEANGQFPVALPVAHVEGLVPDKPGDTSPLSGKVVMESISRAVGETLAGHCRALVTAPIHKAALYNAGFKYPGHTEYLAALCANGEGTPLPVMMLLHDDLRVVPLTVHVPLRDVPGLITPRLVRETAMIVEHDLRTRFGIEEPRLCVTGLNPHAGESGSIGTEDRDIILPTVLDLQRNGINIEGPVSADTIFYLPNWRRYDAIIAMYHDQALIPIKTVAFDEGVNITLGLPIVRTSPDHGTAFDLAGSGNGSMNSMLASIRLADRLTA